MELQHIIIGLFVFLGLRFWWQLNKAREVAEKQAKKLCAQENVQLLDGTVSLSKLSLKKRSLLEYQLEKHFKFEFSAYGSERRTGSIVLQGLQQQYVFMDLPERPTIELDDSNIH